MEKLGELCKFGVSLRYLLFGCTFRGWKFMRWWSHQCFADSRNSEVSKVLTLGTKLKDDQHSNQDTILMHYFFENQDQYKKIYNE